MITMLTKKMALAFLFMCFCAVAAEPGTEQMKGAAGEKKNEKIAAEPTAQEIQELIEQLASKNKAPDTKSNNWKLNYPADWKEEHQEIVEAASQKLYLLGKPAFPALLANIQDKRYSMTRLYAAYVNHSVGSVCELIIKGHVEVVEVRYKSRKGADGEWHGCPALIHDKYGNDLQKWWAANKEKDLRQMQIEALKWKIEEERKVGFIDAKEREQYMTPLQALLEKVEAGK